MDRRKLIVVSNRGPVTYARAANGERIARRGGGGLVTALRSLVMHHDVTWIASAMTPEDRAVAAEAGGAFTETARDGSSYRLRLVAHDEQAYDWFYNVIANPTLWFLQHYLWDLTNAPNLDHGMHHAWDEGYVPVNRGFADAVIEELDRDPSAAVFFHDYHLYLAPRFVRDARPDARLAHFVHIPWPQTDYWYVLPLHVRRALHDGLLANDSVGFHTSRWRRNFMRSAEDVVGASCDWARDAIGYEGRKVTVTAAPISVDPSEFDELAQSEPVLAAGRVLAEGRPEKVILRVDRTDPSKNIVRGFRAFEIYLDAHPEMHRRVVLLTLLDPSRQDIPGVRGVRRRDPARSAPRQRSLPAGGVDADRPADQRRLPAGGRRVQGLRRAARQRDLRRAEPRREGSAARQRARRRPHPFGERGRARGARRLGGDGQPVRRRGPGGGDPPRARDARRGATRPARGDSGLGAGARPRGLDRGTARCARFRAKSFGFGGRPGAL